MNYIQDNKTMENNTYSFKNQLNSTGSHQALGINEMIEKKLGSDFLLRMHEEKMELQLCSIIHSSVDIHCRTWGFKAMDYYIDKIELGITIINSDVDSIIQSIDFEFNRGDGYKLIAERNTRSLELVAPQEIHYNFNKKTIEVILNY